MCERERECMRERECVREEKWKRGERRNDKRDQVGENEGRKLKKRNM